MNRLRHQDVTLFCIKCEGKMPAKFERSKDLLSHLKIIHGSGSEEASELVSKQLNGVKTGKLVFSASLAQQIFKEMQARGPIAPLLELGFEVMGAPADPPEEIPGPSAVAVPQPGDPHSNNEEEILKLLSELVHFDPENDNGDEYVVQELCEEVEFKSVSAAVMKELGALTAEETAGEMWLEMIHLIEENTKDETETRTLYTSCLKPLWIFLNGKKKALDDLQNPQVVKSFMKIVLDVCHAGALSYMKVLKLIMTSRGRFRHADSLEALCNIRKTKVTVLVFNALRKRNELLISEYPNPKQVLQELKLLYLKNQQKFVEVSAYFKGKCEENDVQRDGNWNSNVAFVMARNILKVAARPGNIANLTVEDIAKAKKIEDKWAVYNPNHKVKEKSPCYIFFEEDEFLNVVMPIAKIARNLNPGQQPKNMKVFVTSTGAPMRKSSIVFKDFRKLTKKNIGATIIRHLVVRVVHGNYCPVEKDLAARVLLHSVGMASKVYKDVTPVDILNDVRKFVDGLHGDL